MYSEQSPGRIPPSEKHSEQSPERIPPAEKLLLKVVDGFLRIACSARIEDPHNHLPEIRQSVEQENDCIIYEKHDTFLNPYDLLGLIKLIDPKKKLDVLMPASDYHLNNNKIFSAGAKAIEHYFDVTIFPLIQSYMVGNPKYGKYEQKDANARNLSFFRELKRRQRKKIPTALGIYPEGTRDWGPLLPAEEGFTLAANYMRRPLMYVPFTTHFEGPSLEESLIFMAKTMNFSDFSTGHMSSIEDYTDPLLNLLHLYSRNYNIFRHPIGIVGKPYLLNEGDALPENFSHILMHNLIADLPPNMWGEYR